MRKTFHIALLLSALALLGSSAQADEISAFDSAIQADLPALDTVFAAFPSVDVAAGLDTTTGQFSVDFVCSLTDTACNAAGFSTQIAFEGLFPTLFPGCLTFSPSCDDTVVFGGNQIEYTFHLEPRDLPVGSVPEPGTLMLVGVGLLTCGRFLGKRAS